MKARSRLSVGLALALLVLTGILAVGRRLLAQAPAQQVKARATIAEFPHPAIEGSAIGEVKPFERKTNDVMNDILAHPTPVIALTFSLDQNSPHKLHGSQLKVDLPFEAKEVIERYWKAYLGFMYRTEYQHVPEPQMQVDEDRAIGALASTTELRIQEMIIVTPDGARKISFEEAGGIIRFIGLSAFEVVRQAKEQK